MPAIRFFYLFLKPIQLTFSLFGMEPREYQVYGIVVCGVSPKKQRHYRENALARRFFSSLFFFLPGMFSGIDLIMCFAIQTVILAMAPLLEWIDLPNPGNLFLKQLKRSEAASSFGFGYKKARWRDRLAETFRFHVSLETWGRDVLTDIFVFYGSVTSDDMSHPWRDKPFHFASVDTPILP